MVRQNAQTSVDHTVSDIFGFVYDLRNIQVDDHSVLFSYDISSLFANVPVDETIEILAKKAFKGDWFNEHNLRITKADLVELLNIATKNQLFQFEGTLYEQVDNVAMGSPLGPLMVNTFMCSIKERLQDQGKVPDFYKRYVDDTLSVMPNVETAEAFLSTLNNSHPSIRDFVTAKVLGDVRSKQTCDDKKAPVRIILPFKDQRSANCVRRQLGELSRKIGKDIHPVYTTLKIGANIRQKKANPSLLTNNALFTILSVICAMRIMSATHADTCINALKNIRDLPSRNTSEINMRGTQVTYLLDSRPYRSARANLTA